MIPNEKLAEWYGSMWRIRLFEEEVKRLYMLARIRGTCHLSIGQEATAAGACAALRPDDYITSTHRGHGHCIAKGADPKRMMAEILGKATGYCAGKGGSMHVAAFDKGILGANAIVGGGLPIAVGVGLACLLRGTDQVVLSFFGDGASNQGTFHEALNLAAVWKLPVVFFCENNLYAETTPIADTMPVPNVAIRSSSYGMPGATVDGNNVLVVYEAVSEASERARRGAGPSLVEGMTYRWEGHWVGDPEVYRTQEEKSKWKEERDPVVHLRRVLLERGYRESQVEAIEEEARATILEAVEYALNSPEPSIDTLYEDIYCE